MSSKKNKSNKERVGKKNIQNSLNENSILDKIKINPVSIIKDTNVKLIILYNIKIIVKKKNKVWKAKK